MDSNLNNLNYKVKVLDNFLSANDYNELCKLKFNIDRNKEINIFNNEINDNGIIKSSIDENLLLRLHKNYHSKAISILGQLNQSKVNLYEYSDFTIIVTSKNARFPIHDDTPNKLLSGVIYLSPQKNTGTSFYTDKKGSNKTDITWKTNRAVFFSRKERQTWHSYKGDGLNIILKFLDIG